MLSGMVTCILQVWHLYKYGTKPLDELLFEMGFFLRLLLQTQEVGFSFSRWMLQILKLTTLKQWAGLLQKCFNHEMSLNTKKYSRKAYEPHNMHCNYWVSFWNFFCKSRERLLFEIGFVFRLSPGGFFFEVLWYRKGYRFHASRIDLFPHLHFKTAIQNNLNDASNVAYILLRVTQMIGYMSWLSNTLFYPFICVQY